MASLLDYLVPVVRSGEVIEMTSPAYTTQNTAEHIIRAFTRTPSDKADEHLHICYRKVTHSSIINAIVLSDDGRRLVTGSDDSTMLVWSTQNGSTLCRIKAHLPVLSIAACMGGKLKRIPFGVRKW